MALSEKGKEPSKMCLGNVHFDTYFKRQNSYRSEFMYISYAHKFYILCNFDFCRHKMKCLHGEPADHPTTQMVPFGFHSQNPSCNFLHSTVLSV